MGFGKVLGESAPYLALPAVLVIFRLASLALPSYAFAALLVLVFGGVYSMVVRAGKGPSDRSVRKAEAKAEALSKEVEAEESEKALRAAAAEEKRVAARAKVGGRAWCCCMMNVIRPSALFSWDPFSVR
jgi:hypothetical protein